MATQQEQYDVALAKLTPEERSLYQSKNTATNPYKGDVFVGKSKPVSSLSTTSGQKTYQGLVDQLNKIQTGLTDYQKQQTPTPTTPVAKPPVATFTNENGQTAKYTQEQLNDPNIQSQLKAGGYMQLETEGPTLLAGEVSQAEQEVENLANQIKDYNVENDPAFSAKAKEISTKYAKLKEEMKQINYQRSQALQTMGYVTGAIRYTSSTQLGIEGEELKQADARLSELNSQEQSELANAKEAIRTGKFTELYKSMDAMEKVRAMKKEALEEYNKSVGDVLKKTEEAKKQATKDTIIAQMMSQGVTDPIELLTALNEGGMTINAEDLAKTMKNLTGTTDTSKLTGDTKNFYLLKNSDNLPESITSLPEGQQLFAYINMTNEAERKKTVTGTKANPITMAEAKSGGFPISVVGMDEPTVIASLSLPNPPNWWIDVAKSKGVTTTPEITASWNEIRKELLTNKSTTKSGSSREL